MPTPKRQPRRTQKQRSEETRGRLIEATIALLAERGYSRLTTADIAKRAGVSNGARVHHFPTKEQLVVAANHKLYDDAVALGTLRSKHAASSPDPIRDCFDDLLSLYFGRFFLGSLDAVIAARTDRRLARKLYPIIEAYHVQMRQAWVAAFADAGHTPQNAGAIYAVVLGTVRGMALASSRAAAAPDAPLVATVLAMLQRCYAKP